MSRAGGEGLGKEPSAHKGPTAGEEVMGFGPEAMRDAAERLTRLGIEMRTEQYRHTRERERHELLMRILQDEVAEAIRYFKRAQEDTAASLSPAHARQPEPIGEANKQEPTA